MPTQGYPGQTSLQLATNATAANDTLKTVTRLASVARETGSVAAADWWVGPPARRCGACD